jgi:ketosteroid isomerase-like protein
VSESNVEMARRGYDAALRGDLDVIGEMLDPDVKWHAGDPSAVDACHNRAEALQLWEALSREAGLASWSTWSAQVTRSS